MKEYNNQKLSLIDDDEEGGEEPDLIANHELNDIVDKQYGEISDFYGIKKSKKLMKKITENLFGNSVMFMISGGAYISDDIINIII